MSARYLAAGLAVGAAVGYARIRAQAPRLDLPLGLRARATALMTVHQYKLRAQAARLCLAGESVMFNMEVTGGQVSLRTGRGLIANCVLKSAGGHR